MLLLIGPTTGNRESTRIYTQHAGRGIVRAEKQRWWTCLIALNRHYRRSSRINDSGTIVAPHRSASIGLILIRPDYTRRYAVCMLRERSAVEPEQIRIKLIHGVRLSTRSHNFGI